MGPMSKCLGATCMIVTPVSVSPFRTVWMQGEAPRQRGSKDGCTFRMPYGNDWRMYER